MNDRWDVVVLGLEAERDVEPACAAAAAMLRVEPEDVRGALDGAPSPVALGVSDDDARHLVERLRGLGFRVKPRAADSSTMAPSVPPPSSAPAARGPGAEPGATAAVPSDSTASRPPSMPPRWDGDLVIVPPTPREPLPVPFGGGLGARAVAPPPRAPTETSASGRSPLEAIDLRGILPPSGLELDLPEPRTARPSSPPRRGSVPPPDAQEASPTASPGSAWRPAPPPVTGVADRGVEPHEELSFWALLPGAFLVPLQRTVLPGLFLGPCFAAAAVLFAVAAGSGCLGVFGIALAGLAFVGVTLQMSNRCLWAAAVGERVPARLSADVLPDYVIPAIGVLFVQAVGGSLVGFGSLFLVKHGVPPWALRIATVPFVLYGVTGFALSAARGSAIGYLDVGRIVGILVRAPLEVGAIAGVGALVEGAALSIAVVQIAAAMSTGSGGAMLFAAALAATLLAVAFTYGTALTATLMGLLFRARPEVAG